MYVYMLQIAPMIVCMMYVLPSIHISTDTTSDILARFSPKFIRIHRSRSRPPFLAILCIYDREYLYNFPTYACTHTGEKAETPTAKDKTKGGKDKAKGKDKKGITVTEAPV